MLSLKIGIGSAIAIFMANIFNLDNPTSAGTIALLSLLTTKWGTVKLVLRRITTFFVTILFCFLFFELISSHWVAFGLVIACLVGYSEKMKCQNTLSVNAMIAVHYLSYLDFSVHFMMNEFYLILIGAIIAFLLNLVHDYSGEEEYLNFCMQYMEDKIQSLMYQIVHYIQSEERNTTIWKELEDIKEQAEKYIQRIQEIYQEFKNNHTPNVVNNVVQEESAIEKLKKLKEIYDLNIITEEEYEVASASIMFMTKPEYRGAKDFLLKGKVRCGNCHRSLAYTDGGIHPKIYCPHKVQAGRYSHCPEDAYPVSVIEGHIWYSLKRILRILDSVQRESEEKYTDNSFTGKRQQRMLESELEKLKNERIHQYEAYAEGVLSREKYITVKKQLTEKIEKIQSEQKALASVIIEEERYRSRIRTVVQQLEVQIERGKLTKEIIDTMIDTVYVYDKKRIEVILRFDDVLQKVISEYMEGAKGA